TASPLAAQVQSRPTDPPLVTAASESWYQLREPIQFAGERYYHAGSAVFFDGNTMVRSGYYNGVPLYMDTTIEPYSVVLVPVRRGLMQPYERLRRGDLAGTTASRTPSFPVRATADVFSFPGAPGAPTQLQQPIGAIASSLEIALARPSSAPVPVTTGAQPATPARSEPMVSILRPESNDGVWVRYQGQKWVSAGAAVPLRAAEFRAVGQYGGFPVFVRHNEEKTIYLPTRAGLVAPYRARE
ncbi:MAG: hypothetical protein ACRD26_07750, partial [Vicinamibacterales bacterium]